MFWDFVGAILFVSIGIPIIIYLVILLLSGGVTALSNKSFRQGCLALIAVIIIGVILLIDSNQKASRAAAEKYNQVLTYNRNYLQSLRVQNNGLSGYILISEDTNGKYSTVNNTDGKFNIYKTYSECYTVLNNYTDKYLLNSFDYKCQLL